MQKIDQFLKKNGYVAREPQKDIVFNYESLRGLKTKDLTSNDERFIIDSLYRYGRFLNFSDPKNFEIDRVHKNQDVEQFWKEVFEHYFITYRMGKNEFMSLGFGDFSDELTAKAFELNIKELPIEKMKIEFENRSENVKKVLFDEQMLAAVLKIFNDSGMEEKIRSEYIELAMEINNEYFENVSN